MRQTGALLLVGAVAGTGAAAASLPKGVSPEFAQFYTGAESFACINHADVVLQAAQVNDGSCDCPDGSDEPGTAACAFLDPLSPPQPLSGPIAAGSTTANSKLALPGFWCENKGHIGAYVPFAYVNDGVCDYELCCDGTEEYAHHGGVKCENRCAAMGKEHRRVEAARRQGQERAAKRKATLAKKAGDLRAAIEARVAKYRSEIVELEAKRNQLEKALADTERAERSKVVHTGSGSGTAGKATGKLGVLVSLARKRVDELRDTLDKVLDHRDDLQDKLDALEKILGDLKEQHNPNFNDAGVKAAVHAWEDYAARAADEKKPAAAEADVYEVLKEDSAESGVNWAEFETDDTTDTDAYLPPPLRDYIHEKKTALRVWLVENGILADNGADAAANEAPAVKSARQAFQNAENDLTARRSSLADDEADLAQDYGTADVFRALKDQCISIDVGEYDYELCWLAQATQKSKKGHGHTSLGRFERIDTELADEEDRLDGKSLGKGPRTVLRYENGQHCWNGPNRRVDVWLGCAETEEIWRVTEAEKCVYKMEVGTPIACGEDAVTGAAKGKDEL